MIYQVGINYDKKTKQHSCGIECVTDLNVHQNVHQKTRDTAYKDTPVLNDRQKRIMEILKGNRSVSAANFFWGGEMLSVNPKTIY